MSCNQDLESKNLLRRKNKKITLTIMEISQIDGKEEEILDTAAELKITFYDASYAYFAEVKQIQLITEDLRLIKKNNSHHLRFNAKRD